MSDQGQRQRELRTVLWQDVWLVHPGRRCLSASSVAPDERGNDIGFSLRRDFLFNFGGVASVIARIIAVEFLLAWSGFWLSLFCFLLLLWLIPCSIHISIDCSFFSCFYFPYLPSSLVIHFSLVTKSRVVAPSVRREDPSTRV